MTTTSSSSSTPTVTSAYDLPKSAQSITTNLERTHQIVSFTPDGDRELAYQIVLPKDWIIESELEEGSDHFPQWRLIGLFAPAVDPLAPFISVSVTTLPFEVNLEDWCDFFCGMDGWEVFYTRWWQTPYGLVVDTGAYKGDGTNRDVMRVMVVADNRRIFMTSGVAQANQWEKWKNDFLVACSTFELEKRCDTDALEAFSDWTGGTPAFNLSYPGSWQLHVQSETPTGKSAVEIQLIHGQEMLAYVLVKATSLTAHPDTTLQKLVDQALQELQGSGFSRTGNTWFVPTTENQKLSPTWRLADRANDPIGYTIEGYKGTAIISGRVESRDVEARLGFRFIGDMAFSIYLISVRQEKNFLLWMRSKRCFEIVRENLWVGSKPEQVSPFKFEKTGGAITDITKGKWAVCSDAGWKLLGNGRVSYASVMATGSTTIPAASATTPKSKSASSPTSRKTNRWMEDKETNVCLSCNIKFNVMVRRHHCRNCGRIFCNKCSTKRLPIPSYLKPQRVCNSCYKGITTREIEAIGSFPPQQQPQSQTGTPTKTTTTSAD